ncbi:MAG: DUF4962 domain-containing protein [bacterium]|nr:DUF4962 domain-containing protein [bacterium]
MAGSLKRVTNTGLVRNTLIVNLVNWVLQDPDDSGITELDYELGTDIGQICPVHVRLKNYSGAESGKVVLYASTDSSNWVAVDSANYSHAGDDDENFWFEWTPAFESRYFLRAAITTTGTDLYPTNNSAGLLVTTFDQAVHPKLFFTAAEIPTLQTLASTTHANFALQLTNTVNVNMSYVAPAPEAWESVNYSYISSMLANAALKAVLTPTQPYIDNVKYKALTLCRYPHWETGNIDMDIYSSRTCQALALAYDWCYPYFTKAERDTIHTKLRTQMQRLAAAGPKWIWWSDAYTHNHNINCMSYLGAACYALYEEEPEAVYWEDLAMTNLDNVLALYAPVTDGSWYEAMNYWGFITWTMMPHVWLMREQRGIDYFDTPWIQSMAKYRIYGSMPNPASMVMLNESQNDEWYGPDDQLMLFAREYNNGEAQWLSNQLVSRQGYSLDGPLGFFFYDPTVIESVPSDKSWIATDQDTYFGRSVWNDTTATFVALKCGLVCGRNAYETFWGGSPVGDWEPSHFLPEQNCFSLAYGRDYLIQPAGLQSPVHRTYNSTTMLVNGKGQIGDSLKNEWPLPINRLSMNPHLADTFMLETVDYVVGDATTSYPSTLGLTRYQRHFLYVRPDLLVIVDDMKAAVPSTFTFLLRNRQNIFSYSPSSIFIDGTSTDADMFMLAPANRSHQYMFTNYYNATWGGWGMYVSNAAPDTAVRFVNAFMPRRPAQAIAELLHSDAGLTVLRVRNGGNFEATCAISHGQTADIDVDSLHTDASLAVVIQHDSSSALKTGVVRQGSFLDWGTPTIRLFESPDPVDVEWTLSNDTLRIDGTVGEWAIIYAPNTVSVWLNGVPEAYYLNGDYVEIGSLTNVPQGLITDLRLGVDEGDLTLYWSEPVFIVQGVPVFPAFYDIYSSTDPDSSYRLLDIVPRGTTSYGLGYAQEDRLFYHVVSRLVTTAPPLVELPHGPRDSKARNSPPTKAGGVEATK